MRRRSAIIGTAVLTLLLGACGEAPNDSVTFYLSTLRARAQLDAGAVNSACKTLRQLARDRDDAVAWTNLGIAEERHGKSDAAEQAWIVALQRDPTHVRAHFLLARARLGGAQTARDAARAQPQDADRWDARATALLDSAQGAVQRALAGAPSEAAVHALAAAVSRARGDTAAASRALDVARGLDPLAAGTRADAFTRIVLPPVPREGASGQQPVHFESVTLDVRGTGLCGADVNGDGRRDLVVLGSPLALVADTSNASVVWQPRELVPGGDIQQVVAAPWDADARPDLLLFARAASDSSAAPRTRAWLVRGDGRDTERVGELPGAVRRACALDLDRDIDLDVVIATAGAPGLRLWRNDGNGHFEDVTPEAWASLPGMVDVVAADLEGDTTPDLVCAESGGHLRYLAQRSDMSWADLSTIAGLALQRGRTLALLDVEPDGTLDLVVGNEDGLWVLANRGGGRFTRAAAYRAPKTSWWPGKVESAAVGAIAIADCDADGRPDVTTLHPADVVPVAPVVAAVGSSPSEDAAPPVAFKTEVPSSLRVWRADPSGVFLEATARFALDVHTLQATRPVWSDFDLDGDVDLAVVGQDGLVQVQWNRGESANRIVGVTLSGDSGPRAGIGARLLVCAGGVAQAALVEVQPFEIGIGGAGRLDAVHVTWPDGRMETHFDVPLTGRTLQLQRGRD